MGTAIIQANGGSDQDGDESRRGAEGAGDTCGVLGQMDDDRIRLMGLIVRTHRRLTDESRS